MARGTIAILDANILYSATLRDVFVEMSGAGIFGMRLTEDIHREWMSARLRSDPAVDRAMLEQLRNLMETRAPDCLVTGYEGLVDGLNLPDPDDRHVLAAAIAARCDVIVTKNVRDFPPGAIAAHKLKVQHPDGFVLDLLSHASGPVCSSLRAVRTRWRRPAYTAEQFVTSLERQGLVSTAAELRRFIDLI